jgi:PKD repeat protein
MKKLLLMFISIVLLAGMAQAIGFKQVDRQIDQPSFVGWVPNEFIIVMKADVGRLKISMAQNAVVKIGDASFDAISEQFATSRLEKQFAGSVEGYASATGELARYYTVKFENGTLEDAMAAYEKNPMVDHVEPIGIHSVFATPNDGFFTQQWHHSRANDQDIDTPEAWDSENGDSNIVVALMDSGVRYYHKDLGGANASSTTPTASRGNLWLNQSELNGTAGVDDDGNGFVDDWVGWDFVTGVTGCWSGEDCSTADNDPRDFNGHGTHCAGNVAGLTNDGYGTAGVAGGFNGGTLPVRGNGARVMSLRIGYSAPSGGVEVGFVRMDFAAQALNYARVKGAKIASCSWGASNSGGLGAAIDAFLANGGLIFKAAGNANNQTTDYMTARTDIISVAALDTLGRRADFSSYGTWVDISAPGTNILSDYHDHANPANDYVAAVSGTSMATPITAGVAALVWSKHPTWTATQVRDTLLAKADNINGTLAAGDIGKMGTGRVNANAAVNAGAPPVAPVAQFVGAPLSGNAPLTVNFTDQSTNGPTSWSWDFGDLGTSTSQNPSHVYSSAGTYTVTLTATNSAGSDAEVKTGYITVNTPPPASCDDFNDNNITNWGNSTGTWSAASGIVTGNSNTVDARRTSPFGAFTSLSIQCDVRMNTGRNQRNARIIFSYVDANNYRFVEADDLNNRWRIYERVGGTNTVRLTVNATVATATWYTVVVNQTSTGSASFKVNGTSMGSYNFGTAPSGQVGIGFTRSNSNWDNFCVGSTSGTFQIGGGEIVSSPDLVAPVDAVVLPNEFSLKQNYPNPFNPTTEIAFTLGSTGRVNLSIYNVLGERVVTLVDDVRSAGEHRITWDSRSSSGSKVSSGVYFYRLEAYGITETKKMILMK